MVPLHDVFHVKYGNKLDANKLTFCDAGINFVSRASKNLGIVGHVEEIAGELPNEAGAISVTMGGSYLLSAFVQPAPFYTAQNVKVLVPRESMTLAEKAYYCRCILENRRRYSTHGREANRSFNFLLVPDRADVPDWVKEVSLVAFALKTDHRPKNLTAVAESASPLVRLDKLFDVRGGILVGSELRSDIRTNLGYLPYVRPSKRQITSFVEFVDSSPFPTCVFPRHTLYVSTNGQGSHTYAYVSTEAFVPNSDVSALIEKREMSLQEKLYYAAAITANRRLFSYGRKPKGERLKSILLPERAPSFVYNEDLTSKIAS